MNSYTIGEGVNSVDRWPVMLADRLREQGMQVEQPWIIARTGWTTGDLVSAISMQPPVAPFDLVTLLIGVNNQYQGRPIEIYREQFRALLTHSIDLAEDRPGRVIVLSIPDWGATPFARGADTAKIAMEIAAFNRVNQQESQKAGVCYVNVTPTSREALQDPTLLASDQLHPSGKMYALWVDMVLPVAIEALKE